MKKYLEGAIVFMIICVTLISNLITVSAYEKIEHNEYLELVLFGQKNYKSSLSKEEEHKKEAIEALEAASYLCVDQFNGYGTSDIVTLNKFVPDLKVSLDDIDFSSNYKHRKFTHKGWNYDYTKKSGENKANWPKRKEILQLTVKEIFARNNLFVETIEKFKALFVDEDYNKQYDSFCALIYYIHILGDQLDRTEYEEEFIIMPFIQMSGHGEYNIVQELKDNFKVLFASQKNKKEYKELIRELDAQRIDAERYYNEPGGLYIPDNFKKYKKCEEKVMDILGEKVPKLLQKEKFFAEIFER